MNDTHAFHCICFSCDEEFVAEDYDEAQEFFDPHAERGHEVEIRRLNGEDGDERDTAI